MVITRKLGVSISGLLIIIVSLVALLSSSSSALLVNQEIDDSNEEESFTEELLLRPINDGKVLSHFHFNTRVPPTHIYGRHHRIFPKAIYQLVQKFRIREMELSFTQGRWNYERWGGSDHMSSTNAKPPGVELWAVLDVPDDQIDPTWRNLTHALSGLFCASINFLESSASYATPSWSFPRNLTRNIRYGALPREAVCTENLTPWLKLLPCRDKAGIAALMDRPSIYRGYYHSQRLFITSSEFDSSSSSLGTTIEQTLTLVLQPSMISGPSLGKRMLTSWSISSLFGKSVSGKCVLAIKSNIFLEFEGPLVKELDRSIGDWYNKSGSIAEKSWSNTAFELLLVPERLIREVKASEGDSNKQTSLLYHFSANKLAMSATLDVGIIWKSPVSWSCFEAPFHASRFLMGSGNARGSIAISLESTHSKERSTCASDRNCQMVQVNIFQVVPWYIKIYFHTLQFYVDGHPVSVSDVVKKMKVLPSVDKVSPGIMEILLAVSYDTESISLTLDFEKVLLHIDEYPPDAYQGFDLPSALVSFPDFQAGATYHEKDILEDSPILVNFQQKASIRLYTEILLVPLTTPDFSMPYNVITLICTVLALYFGSLLNVLRRRVGEEERSVKGSVKEGLLTKLLSKLLAKRGRLNTPLSPSTLKMISKLIKIVMVVVIGVALNYILNSEKK